MTVLRGCEAYSIAFAHSDLIKTKLAVNMVKFKKLQLMLQKVKNLSLSVSFIRSSSTTRISDSGNHNYAISIQHWQKIILIVTFTKKFTWKSGQYKLQSLSIVCFQLTIKPSYVSGLIETVIQLVGLSQLSGVINYPSIIIE